MKEEGGKRLGRGADGVCTYGLLLGLMGSKAEFVADKLEALQKVALTDDSAASITLGFALARIDPKRADRALRTLFKRYPAIFEDFGRGTLVVLSEHIYLLTDRSISTRLAGMVKDPDVTIADGAILSLACAGLAASDAVPALLEHFRKGANKSTRVKLAECLGSIAQFDQLPLLEQLIAEERSRSERRALRTAVDSIRFLGTVQKK